MKKITLLFAVMLLNWSFLSQAQDVKKSDPATLKTEPVVAATPADGGGGNPKNDEKTKSF